MTVEIWGKEACPSCVKAKAFVEQRSMNYVYKQLGVDFSREEVFENFPEARTFPQIKVGGNIVGGFEAFVKYVEDTGYNGTGHSL